MKLSIELIPISAAGSSLSKRFKGKRWDTVRRYVYKRENYHCHICGIKSDRLEAHEIWEFNEKTHIQKLVDVIGICKACHSTIHFGRTQKLGHEEDAKKQFFAVNNCGRLELALEIKRAKSQYDKLSKIPEWILDLKRFEELEKEASSS